MTNIAKIYPEETSCHYLGAANVIKLADCEGMFRIRLVDFKGDCEVSARITAPLIDTLEIGDEVLVTGDVYGDLYVIGLLASINKHQEKMVLDKLDIGNGAYAVVDNFLASPALKLFSKRNELLVEYDPASEKVRINIDSGDLEFITHNGDILLSSANNIQLKGQNIELTGQTGIQLGVTDTIGKLVSSFSLGACKASLSSAKLRVTSHLGELHFKETRFSGSRFWGKIEDSQLIVDRLTTVVNTITEKAQNVYRSVEQLSQLKTGRMRTLVESTFHLKAKKTYLKSQEDFKVNADKIHLG